MDLPGTEGSEYLQLDLQLEPSWQGCCRGGEDLFIMELDSDASSVQKVFETGSSADETLQGGLVLDADEAVILAGYTNGGLGGNSNAGEADGYVMKVPRGIKGDHIYIYTHAHIYSIYIYIHIIYIYII